MPNTENYNRLLGFYGGSFDPVHLGHIEPVRQAARDLGVKSLSFIPCYLSPLKNKTHSATQHRIEMLKLAIKDYPELHVDLREAKRSEVSYTVDTLRELTHENRLHNLCFFMGMDSLQTFTKWHNWQEILTLAHLVVMHRGDYAIENLNIDTALSAHITVQPKDLTQTPHGKILIIETVKLAISSSDIRHKIKQKLATSGLLSEEVANYIEQHELYLR